MVSWSDVALHWQPHPISAAAIVAYAWGYRRAVTRRDEVSGTADVALLATSAVPEAIGREHREGQGAARRDGPKDARRDASRRRRRWPTYRKLAFTGSIVAATLATQSGLARYDHHSFTVHMVQHALLALVVPLLVVLSAPVTLALQATPERSRRGLRWLLYGPVGRLLTHPLVGWSLFGGGLVALYLTPLLDLAVHNPTLHLAVQAHMVLAGILFLAPLVGTDAVPCRLPYPGRLLLLLTAVPFHTVVALALLTATSPVAPEAYPDLAGQREAAAVFWGTGELLTLAAAAVVVRQWWVAEQRATRRELAADAPLLTSLR